MKCKVTIEIITEDKDTLKDAIKEADEFLNNSGMCFKTPYYAAHIERVDHFKVEILGEKGIGPDTAQEEKE